jgi:hypothetical protein
MVRTHTRKLIVRPQGESELYSYADDPRERYNLYGDRSVSGVQVEMQSKPLHYIATTVIAPFDKDSRNARRSTRIGPINSCRLASSDSRHDTGGALIERSQKDACRLNAGQFKEQIEK